MNVRVRNAAALAVAAVVLSLPLTACKKETAFSHEGHVNVAKGRCAVCHGDDAAAPRLPAVESCKGCHPQAAEYFADLAERRRREGSPVEPFRVPGLLFSHGSHSTLADGCRACHPISTRKDRKAVVSDVRDCTACHAKEGVGTGCADCHRPPKKGKAPPSHG
jgi:hypothetical protein